MMNCRLGELAEPYWILKDAGYDITIASPAGGAVPIDDASLQGDFKTPECDRMMDDGGSFSQPSMAVT
jgi:putative intracellular protease/amidase